MKLCIFVFNTDFISNTV